MNEYDRPAAPARGSSALSWIGLVAGVAILIVAAVWLVNLSRVSSSLPDARVEAPATATEVAGEVEVTQKGEVVDVVNGMFW